MRRQPRAGEWADLDDGQVLTAYLERKSARLHAGHAARFRADLQLSAVTFPFEVHGDSATYVPVLVQPFREPWRAWCPRGGLHDLTRDGQWCSHMLAAAAELAVTVRPLLGARLEAIA